MEPSPISSILPSNTPTPFDPFSPDLYPDVPRIPEATEAKQMQKELRGLGDLVALAANPIARYSDDHLGTSIVGCGGCISRQDWLNNLLPFKKKQPRPWTRYEPRSERAIVMPWLSTEAVWQELRYSLRSIHQNWTDKECPIYLIGDAAPAWLDTSGRVQFIKIKEYAKSREEGLFRAFQVGMQIANEVVWWNDDIYLLRQTGQEDLRIALTEGDLLGAEDVLRASRFVWKQALGEVIEELKALGRTKVMRFATHTPYLFEIEKSREIFSTYYLHYKGSWVSLYHGHHQTPHRPCGPWKVEQLPTESKISRYLNHGRKGPDAKTKKALEDMFGEPAPWEK